jgi:uncharacterized tellurite resistance protein B-like protein
MGTFSIILLLSVIVAAALALAWLGFHYVRFLSTPEAAWRSKVLEREAALSDNVAVAKKAIVNARTVLQVELEKERQIALNRYMGTLSVDLLQSYPNIGPVTVDTLRKANLTSLDLVAHAHLEALGIAPKRLLDLKKAVEQVLREAKSRFDARGCREAQELASTLEHLQEGRSRQIAQVENDIRREQLVLAQLSPLLDVARRITFIGFLRRVPVSGLTREVLDKPIEDYFSIQETVPPAAPSPPGRSKPVRENPVPKPFTSPVVAPAPVIAAAGPAAPAHVMPVTIDLFRAAIESDKKSAATPEPPRMRQLRMTAEFAFAVARSDGKIAKSERKTIERFLKRAFGGELSSQVKPSMEQAEKSSPDLEICLSSLRAMVNVAELENLYDFAGDIADAAGKRNAREIKCLERIAAAWGLDRRKTVSPVATGPTKNVSAETSATVPPLVVPEPPAKPAALNHDDFLAALEIAPSAAITADLVRRQYRLLSERFDPTRFESHGADFVTVAKSKREKVEQAARFLLDQMGEKFEEEKKPEPVKDLRHNPDLDSIFGG